MIKSISTILLTLASLMIFVGCNQDSGYFVEVQKNGISEDESEQTPPNTFIVSEDPEKLSEVTGGENNDQSSSESSNETSNPPGSQAVLNTDSFNQVAQRSAVDILWVVDDSGSMKNEQDALAYNFSAFINQFLDEDVDFKMGITTTDGRSSKNGKEVSGSMASLTAAKAAADEAGFKDDFADLIRVGTEGSGHEKGLQTSAAFLDRYADSWLRDDAYLVVVYVSDEEDVSAESVAHYHQLIQSHKANAGLVKSYGIVNMSGQQSSSQAVNFGKERYEDMTELTGGSISAIHADFYETLLDIGNQIVTLTSSFPLSQKAVANSIVVKVDGIEIDSYSYDAQNRAIAFDQGYIPAEGSSIDVTYQVQ